MDDVCRCYAHCEADRLTVGNDHVERTWLVRGDRLLAERFEHKPTGRQWIAPTPQAPAAADAGEMDRTLSFASAIDRASPVSVPSLHAVLRGQGVEYSLRIYPGANGVEIQVVRPTAAAIDLPPSASAAPTGIEHEAQVASHGPAADAIDALTINPLHLRLVEVTLADQTDWHDNLVFERSWLIGGAEGRIECQGNLFWLGDTLSGEGLIVLKPAPLPHARPLKSAHDLVVQGGALSVHGHGATAADGADDPVIILSYSGGRTGRIRALQDYQRQVRPYLPGRDGLLLSNTWGDRSRDERISEAFMTAEIDAGRDIGVDVVQIDDGWQRGTSGNSINRDQGGVWSGFWAADANFWDPHPQRFPTGIRAIADRAASAGMMLGLWFAPDSADDFAHWQRDADAVLRMHRDWGVNYVKIDGVKAHTRAGEGNLRRFFDAVLAATDGKVVFDLDVTADIRPGYFGLAHVGPLFVENRYTDWHRYWPHRTLRNLWLLSQYIDPLRLRMEFLNNQRRAELYAGDPLAPALYDADYLFASIMFASPLGWFETSNLPPGYRRRLAPLVAVWKAHRAAIHAGTIIPIGGEPDGAQWTGFASIARDGGEAYVLALRELNPCDTWRLDCRPLGLSPRDARILAGDGAAAPDGDGLCITLPQPRRFVLIQLTIDPS